MPERAYVDANVVLRLLVGNPPDMAARARALFERMERGELELVLDVIALAECVWTLQSFYKRTPAVIAPTMRELLLLPNLEVPERGLLLEALTLYEERGVDFVDALLAARLHSDGSDKIYSFDRHFDRLPEIQRLDP